MEFPRRSRHVRAVPRRERWPGDGRGPRELGRFAIAFLRALKNSELRLLRDGCFPSIYFAQNFIAALPQQRVGHGMSQCYGVAPLPHFAQHLSAIWIGYDRVQLQFSLKQIGGSSTRHMATASHAIEQSSFAGRCEPGETI